MASGLWPRGLRSAAVQPVLGNIPCMYVYIYMRAALSGMGDVATGQ